jgi:hypothetical protein
MTAHDHALMLGVTAIDARLDAPDRDELDRHLAACPACRLEIDEIATDARRLRSLPVLRMSPGRAADVRASLEQPGRRLSPAMLLAAAALLLLATIAAAVVGAQVVRMLDESRLAVDDVLPSVTAPAPTAPASAPSSWSLAGPAATTDWPFAAVTRSADRWLAIGGPACTAAGEWAFNCTVPVATSEDGRSWTGSAAWIPLTQGYVPPMSGPLAGVVGLAGGPGGYVAAGFDPIAGRAGVRGVAWWSADGGAWERIDLGDGARPSAVFRAADRWLIGGVVYRGIDLATGRPLGAIWTSTDGRSWTRIEDGAVFDVGGYVDTMEDPASGGIRAFAWNGTTILAVGEVCAADGRPCRAAAWLSPDGASWERAAELPAGDAVETAVGVNGTFVAAARRCPVSGDCSTVVLRSGDGRTWEAIPGELRARPVLVATSGTAVLVTGEFRTLDVRATGDGRTWQSLGTVSAPERVNWDGPKLVDRGDGRIELLVRFDPVDAAESEADAYTLAWEIAPAP